MADHQHTLSIEPDATAHTGSGSDDGHAPGATVKDPVCGMSVDPHTAAHRADHDGHPYYFCAAGCRTKFVADPAKYLTPRGIAVARAGA